MGKDRNSFTKTDTKYQMFSFMNANSGYFTHFVPLKIKKSDTKRIDVQEATKEVEVVWNRRKDDGFAYMPRFPDVFHSSAGNVMSREGNCRGEGNCRESSTNAGLMKRLGLNSPKSKRMATQFVRQSSRTKLHFGGV